MRSVLLRSFGYVAIIALGAVGTTIAPASAHYITTRCDRDGDSCYRVVCDDDGDDCHRISSYSRYGYDRRYGYSRRGYGGSYWSGYGSGNQFGLYYDSGSDGWYNNNGWYNDGLYGLYGNNENEDEDE